MVHKNTYQLATATASTAPSKESNSKISLNVNHLTRDVIDHKTKIRGSRNNIKEITHLSRIRRPRKPRRGAVDAVFQPTGTFR